MDEPLFYRLVLFSFYMNELEWPTSLYNFKVWSDENIVTGTALPWREEISLFRLFRCQPEIDIVCIFSFERFAFD